MEFRMFHQDPSRLHIGCEKPRSYFIPTKSAAAAFCGRREASERFCLLSGTWQFRWYSSFADFRVGDLSGCGGKWDAIEVPRCWQTYVDRDYDKPNYINLEYPFPIDPPYVPDENPCGLYRRTVTLDVSAGERRFINFEGVSSAFYLWINGTFAGYSQVSHCTSELEVTDYLHSGENEIAVLVMKWSDGSYLEDQDYFRLSGIFRDVYLLTRPSAFLRDYYVRQTVSADLRCAELRVDLTREGAFPVTAKLYAPDGTLAAEQTGDGDLSFTLTNPVLWNDEEPREYTILFEANGEYILQKLAIRRFVIENGVILLNNRPVKARGVNRHDSHPQLGYTTSEEHMLRDLKLIKQANVNAIRTSHYPNDPRFARYCQSAGIMLIDEADLETHGMGYDWEGQWDWMRWSLLSNAPEWKDAYVDRAARLFERDKNCGCVVLWSLGNESGCGVNHRAMTQFIHSRAPEALVHYENAHLEFKAVPEGECFKDVSDVESRMYAGIEYIDRYFAEKLSDKPFFLCEYVCSMSTGDLFGNWECVMRHPGFFGACVWEWCDHAGDLGGGRYVYGGGFHDFPNSGTGCADGLVYPDRRPRPGYYDMKQVYRPANAVFDGGRVTVQNRRYFRDLSDLDLVWKLECDGVIAAQGRVNCLRIAPQSEGTFELFDPTIACGECVLTASFVQNAATDWADPGFEQGFGQSEWIAPAKTAAVHAKWPVNVCENGSLVTVSAGCSEYTFDLIRGKLTAIRCGGEDMINVSPEFSVWHAPTINGTSAPHWLELFLDHAKQKTYSASVSRRADGAAEITCDISIGPASSLPSIRARVVYTFCTDGAVEIRFDGELKKMINKLPLIGLELHLPRKFENACYYGHGPIEAYSDRHESTKVGFYRTTADANFEHYIRPQENGSHYGTRWARVESGNGHGLYFAPTKDGELCFNISRFTSAQLREARYDFELQPLDETVVRLDYRITGISENGSLFRREPERNGLAERNIRFGFVIKPYLSKPDEFAELGR